MSQPLTAAALALGLLASAAVHATVVQFQTAMGNFEVNLYDETTPETVANFLAYVEAGDYSSSFLHRSVPGFVVQGGGFAYPEDEVVAIPTRGNVDNEPELSNVRGSIAMAKLGGDPDSATSQWFFNLSDNSSQLDAQNGGFTVFGEVVGEGIGVVDNIGQLSRFAYNAPFGELPLRNFSSAQYEAGEEPTDQHLVMVFDIVVTDAAADSAAELMPVANTLIDSVADSGSGASDLILLLGLLLGLRLSRRPSPRSWPSCRAG